MICTAKTQTGDPCRTSAIYTWQIKGEADPGDHAPRAICGIHIRRMKKAGMVVRSVERVQKER